MVATAIGAFLIAYGPVIMTVASLAATAYMAFTAPGPQDGPKIGETKVQTSTYGNVIPIGFGRVRMAGNIIWAQEIQEVASQEDTGGKGGSGSRTVYSYFGNFAIGVCEGPAVAVTRIWADRKIIFDRTGRSNIVRKYPTADIRIFLGVPTQLVDPLIEADIGVGSTSANRGIVYVVFEALPLEDSGNRIPQLQFEVQYSTSTSTTEIELSSMFDWGVDWAQTSPVNGNLYLTRRHDVFQPNAVTFSLVVWDIFNETILQQIGNSPYKNEGVFGSLGFSAQGGIFPGKDGKIYAVGVSLNTNQAALVQINPITLALIKSYNLFDEVGVTQNTMRRGNVVWTQKSVNHVDTWQLMMYNGEGGGSDFDNDVWVFFHRGLGDQGGFTPFNFLDDPVLSDPFVTHRFAFDPPNSRGPVWGNATAVDSNGDLWICGYLDNAVDNAKGILGNRSAKLWHVFMVVRRNSAGSITNFFPQITEIDLADLDPTGRIHRPTLMVYDAASNSLTIWGDQDPDNDFGIVQFSIASRTVINTRFYKTGTEPELQPSRFNEGAGASVVHSNVYAYFQDGTNQDGEIIFPQFGIDAANEWTIYNARNFTFSFNNPGPFITGILSQIYWYKELDWVYAWNGPGTDNPSDDNPVVFERQTVNPSADSLDIIVKKIIADTGVPNSDITTDTTMQNTVVNGFIIANQGRARSAIDPLGFAFFFDAVESGGKIAFRSRGTSSVRTIVQDDLGARSGSGGKGEDDVFVTVRDQETDIPVRVDLQFMDFDRDHQEGNQHALRHQNPTPTQFSNSVQQNALPIVMTAAQAAAIAEIKLYDSWTGRRSHRFQLGPKHMDLEPSDIITVEVTDSPDTLLRLAMTQLGEAFASRMEGTTHDLEVFTTVGTGAKVALEGGVLVFQGGTEGFLLDIPLLSDEHSVAGVKSGFYVAMGGQRSTWEAGLILKSQVGNDGPFELFQSSKGGHAWGYLNVALPALPDQTTVTPGDATLARVSHNERFEVIDNENEIVVRIVNDEGLLASTTEDILFETDINHAIIVDPGDKDRFEIFRFTNVSITSGIATLTGLLRGLRGTEEQSKFGFGAGLRVLFPTRAVTTRKLIPLDDLNTSRVYQIKTTREVIDTSQLRFVVAQGNDLRPLSGGLVNVTPLVGSRSASTITVTWRRRTRLGGQDDLRDAIITTPVSESSKNYEVELIDKGAETVSITKTGIIEPDVGTTFTVGERTTAGYTNNEAIRIKIYQLSDNALVGRGYPRDVTL